LIFYDEKIRGAEAELLVASSWLGDDHGVDTVEKGAWRRSGFGFVFVGEKKGEGGKRRRA
jgi:hypothetical protein